LQPIFTPQKPIFQSIADWLEDAILADIFKEGDQIPSITEISMLYNINPATALKGVNILVDTDMLHKKRGMGMFVSEGAHSKLLIQRQKQFFFDYVQPLITEAKRLQINNTDLIKMIERGVSDDN